MLIGNKEFDFSKHTYVMGILNVTPDSFSDGGKYHSLDLALYHAKQMVDDGADIIDIGGESTRPGHSKISDEEEMERVLPIVEGIKREFDIPISLDTYKSAVAAQGILAGVDLINDIWGLQYDDNLGPLVAESNTAYCLMHNRKEITNDLSLRVFLEQIQADIDRALRIGIKKNKIMIDPGVGFAKTQEQNLMAIGNLDSFVSLGYPVLLGTSRKSVIHYVLDAPVQERLIGTLATTAEAVFSHCGMVRVHDVKENVDFIRMLEASRKKRETNGTNIY